MRLEKLRLCLPWSQFSAENRPWPRCVGHEILFHACESAHAPGAEACLRLPSRREAYLWRETAFSDSAMRRVLLAALLTGFPALFSAPAWADDISVSLDEVQTVSFPRPVTTVNVGNPAIADITMIDARHAFV